MGAAQDSAALGRSASTSTPKRPVGFGGRSSRLCPPRRPPPPARRARAGDRRRSDLRAGAAPELIRQLRGISPHGALHRVAVLGEDQHEPGEIFVLIALKEGGLTLYDIADVAHAVSLEVINLPLAVLVLLDGIMGEEVDLNPRILGDGVEDIQLGPDALAGDLHLVKVALCVTVRRRVDQPGLAPLPIARVVAARVVAARVVFAGAPTGEGLRAGGIFTVGSAVLIVVESVAALRVVEAPLNVGVATTGVEEDQQR